MERDKGGKHKGGRDRGETEEETEGKGQMVDT
jgi:hypothetical protein